MPFPCGYLTGFQAATEGGAEKAGEVGVAGLWHLAAFGAKDGGGLAGADRGFPSSSLR